MCASKRIPGVLVLLAAGVLPVLLVAGCAQPQAADGSKTTARPSSADSPVHAYLLRGLWDFFSLGLNTLATELQAQGVDALAISGPKWPELAAGLASAFADGSDTRPLILVGHSYGADDAVNLARTLAEQNVPVRLLYLLDATGPAPIPANVDRCVHLYIPNELGRGVPQLFPGNPVVPEAGNHHTEIVNQVFSEAELGPGVRGVDHFTIEESELTHQLISAEIQKITAAVEHTSEP
jgi:hypothetical protein